MAANEGPTRSSLLQTSAIIQGPDDSQLPCPRRQIPIQTPDQWKQFGTF